MKTKRQQRRSTVGFVLWSATAICLLAGIINLTDPDNGGADRLFGIGALVGATACAYLAGRWREL